MAIFQRCLEIAGKVEYGGKLIRAKPKNYYINLDQYVVVLHPGYIIAKHLHMLGVTVCNV